MSTPSSNWEITQTTALAQLAAMLTRADTGPGRASLALFSTARPALITDPHADAPQAEIVLAKPSGNIIGSSLVLYVETPAGAMVQSNGLPRWAEWRAADGAVLARCDVTDMDHGGGLRVIGGATPEGETSPMLYTGGLVQLGLVALS